jgi:transcription elongation factor Elf1
MAKEKVDKETPVKVEKEITFTCRFCGETKPFDELVIQTRYFPVLTSCRDCARTLENIRLEEPSAKTGGKAEEDSREYSVEKPGN